MAISVYTDMVVRTDLFDEVFVEEVNQQINAFNAQSNGAIQLYTELKEGHYGSTRFFDFPAGSVSRRDISSTSAVTPTTVTQDEVISVKINRKAVFQPTLDSLIKGGSSVDEFSAAFAQAVASEYLKDQLNTSINACESFLSGETDNNYDASAGTLGFDDLVAGMAKLGDRAMQSSGIAAFVIHSKPWFDLLSAAGTTANAPANEVANMALEFGRVPGIGRPFIVTDSAGLLLDQTTDNYYTLGLVPGAIKVTESEAPRMLFRVEGGLENLTLLAQMEFAYNVEIKGAAWDTTNGGINPNDAAVALNTNWDAVVANKKDKAGVRITSQ